MKLHAGKQTEPSIPTASMADIAFLLIIFFMLTITFEVDKTKVELPRTELRVEIPKKAAYVTVNREGLITVSSGEEMSAPVPSAEEVVSFASGVVTANPSKEFVLKADANTPYSKVDELIDALKRAEVRVIYLLSDQVLREGA